MSLWENRIKIGEDPGKAAAQDHYATVRVVAFDANHSLAIAEDTWNVKLDYFLISHTGSTVALVASGLLDDTYGEVLDVLTLNPTTILVFFGDPTWSDFYIRAVTLGSGSVTVGAAVNVTLVQADFAYPVLNGRLGRLSDSKAAFAWVHKSGTNEHQFGAGTVTVSGATVTLGVRSFLATHTAASNPNLHINGVARFTDTEFTVMVVWGLLEETKVHHVSIENDGSLILRGDVMPWLGVNNPGLQGIIPVGEGDILMAGHGTDGSDRYALVRRVSVTERTAGAVTTVPSVSPSWFGETNQTWGGETLPPDATITAAMQWYVHDANAEFRYLRVTPDGLSAPTVSTEKIDCTFPSSPWPFYNNPFSDVLGANRLVAAWKSNDRDVFASIWPGTAAYQARSINARSDSARVHFLRSGRRP